MLMAAGLELPRRLMIHGYVLKGGEKMSKTIGNVVDPFQFIERYGIDALRYYLAREVRFGEDGTLHRRGLRGPLLARARQRAAATSPTASPAMVGRYRDGVVPATAAPTPTWRARPPRPTDAFRRAARPRSTSPAALEDVWRSCRRLNRYVEERAPWTLAKDPARAGELDQTLFSLAEGLRVAAILLWPVIPSSSERILAALGQDPARVDLAAAVWGAGAAGVAVEPAGPLFPRVEEEAA